MGDVSVEFMLGVVQAEATKLFVANGLRPSFVGRVEPRLVLTTEVLSAIDFAGERTAGLLVLGMAPSLLWRSHPAGGGSAADLADWLNELANMLLGRVKLALMDYRCPIQAGTPTTIVAEDLGLSGSAAGLVMLAFKDGSEAIHVAVCQALP